MIDPRVQNAYDRRARFYDGIVRILSLGRDSAYRRQAAAALKLKGGERVLEIGCGTGLNSRYLKKAGLLVGTDASFGMLRLARGYVRVRAGAGQEIFKPESFDAVLSTYVISTLLGEDMVRTIHRVLRPGGRLVIADDKLPPGWYVGPHLMIPELLKHGWPNLLEETLRALRPRFKDVRVSFCHFGMIYIISAVRP